MKNQWTSLTCSSLEVSQLHISNEARGPVADDEFVRGNFNVDVSSLRETADQLGPTIFFRHWIASQIFAKY